VSRRRKGSWNGPATAPTRAVRILLKLEEPGIVQMHNWRPDPVGVGRVPDADADVAMCGAVARKP
jgi:hypothetical protein